MLRRLFSSNQIVEFANFSAKRRSAWDAVGESQETEYYECYRQHLKRQPSILILTTRDKGLTMGVAIFVHDYRKEKDILEPSALGISMISIITQSLKSKIKRPTFFQTPP